MPQQLRLLKSINKPHIFITSLNCISIKLISTEPNDRLISYHYRNRITKFEMKRMFTIKALKLMARRADITKIQKTWLLIVI